MRLHDTPLPALGDDNHRWRDSGEFDARVGATCAQIEALDAEIATLERAITPLPDVLRLLAGHPVLWLLVGREGIDRPGTLGTIVGQQVPQSGEQGYGTECRQNRRGWL